MQRYKIIKNKPVFSGSIEDNTVVEDNPLSKETDPRVIRLKKELQKLSIAPKPKYIKLFKI